MLNQNHIEALQNTSLVNSNDIDTSEKIGWLTKQCQKKKTQTRKINRQPIEEQELASLENISSLQLSFQQTVRKFRNDDLKRNSVSILENTISFKS